MAVLPEFNGDPILLLQTIFNIFHTKGKWPTYDDVDRIITQKHPNFNLVAVSKSMPDGFAAGFGFQRQYDQEAFFIVPALHYCQEAEEEIADFIRVVRLCVERYDRYYSFGEETPEKDALEFSSELLSSRLHMEPLAIRKMGLLLCHEYDIAFGFSNDIEYNSWHFPLKRGTDGVSRFRGVETFEQYIEKRSPLISPYYTGGYPLGLAQDKPISDMTVMGLRRANTQVHVHGDQYDSSSNIGNIDAKPSLTWDYLINEFQRLDKLASKVQQYKVGNAEQGLPDDEINQFVHDYLTWYSDCLELLPEDLKGQFRSAYETKIFKFLTNPLLTEESLADEHMDDFHDCFVFLYEKWFHIPSFIQRQLLIQASRRELKPNAVVVSEHRSNKHPVFAKEMVMDKVKVLFLAANPLGTDRLKLDEEIRAITEKVYASEYRDYLQVESSWAIRPNDLLQLLNRYRPHIVHFSGHGSQTGELILVDTTGSPKAVSTMALKALFTTLKDNIQVVILNACYSRSQATAITEVINCVVGMNDEIGDEAAIIFAASFYRALGFGRSVQEAFDQGKVALLLEGIPEENTPELLVRTGVNPTQVFLVEQPMEKQQNNQEQQRHRGLLRKLKTEYILSHPNVSERILIGTEPLPKEWVERRLEEMGETWRQDVYYS